MKEVIEMIETMVNGIIFKVWSDFNAKCTLAENEDGDVRIIQSAGYISNDLTIRKAIAMVFGLPTFRKNAVKTASAVEETPVTESKEQDEQEVQETVEQTTEVETKTEEMAETEEYDSGFEYYSVKVAYEAMDDKKRSIVFTNYSEALEIAKHVTKVLGGEKAIVIAVNFVIRNDRQPESERDKMVLEAETAEIESRCVPYNYLGLRGYVSIEDRQVVNEDVA